MSSDEEVLSAEPLQLQPYTADARWVQLATSADAETFCHNRKNKRFDNQSHNNTQA